MPKEGINPVTIRPLDTHPGNAVTLARLHVGTDEKMIKTFSVAVFDEAEVEAARKTEREPIMHMAVIDEDKVIEALGHLFPNAELQFAHLGYGETDVETIRVMRDIYVFVRQIAGFTKEGEPDPNDPDTEDGFVMTGDDNFETLCDLITEARGLQERLQKVGGS